MAQQKQEVRLLNFKDLKDYDVTKQKLTFAPRSSYVSLTNDNTTAEWSEDAQLSWIPVPSNCQFSGVKKVTWDFEISHLGKQIGIGFMLNFTIGVDWGFFGYLGSSGSAWSYDPTTGDVVTDTESIQGGLPTFPDKGVVSVELSLPLDAPNTGIFIVNGKPSSPIEFPPGSVIVPAACFLAKNQKVTMKNLKVEK